MLLGPTEEGPLSGYRSVQQHAVVLVHSKTHTYTQRYTAIISQELRGGVCETGVIINQSTFTFGHYRRVNLARTH